jgi:uncharacterized repeat protein (TIGR01451 family)
VCALTLCFSSLAFGSTPPGAIISNQASWSYVDSSGTLLSRTSNRVDITVDVPRTDARIDIMRVVDAGSTNATMTVEPTYCVQGGDLSRLPDPVLPGGQVIVPDQQQSVVDGELFHIGEPLFFRLQDEDQNLDSGIRDGVEISVRATPGGDSEVIRLTETALDSGIFTGHTNTSAVPVSADDCVLQLVENSSVNVRYQDPADALDAAEDSAIIDPVSLIFDARTGIPLTGARIGLIDVSTGEPALVFGNDGNSRYPATVTSGSSVTDSGGMRYDFAAGGFRFPIVPPGSYRFVVTPPAGYANNSTASITALQSLPGAPFALGAGSTGGPFTVGDDQALHLDVPLDPLAQDLFLQKTTTTGVAGIGDFIRYALSIENTSAGNAVSGLTVRDVLPHGFRYLRGSATLNGAHAGDPEIGPDGRSLTFAAGDLGPGETASIHYAVEVTVGLRAGTATNFALATGNAGARSNEATASVQVSEDLFRSKSLLVGRVTAGSCDQDVSTALDGIAGVRVYLQDGRYAITGDGGRFHFEALEPGTHVAQLDMDTIDERFEVFACQDNSRFAGRAYSQFVDLKPGAVARADFHLRERPPPTGNVSLRLTSAADSDAAELIFTLELQGGPVPITGLKANVLLPDGLTYKADSSFIDGARHEDPAVSGLALSYALQVKAGSWRTSLQFRATVEAAAAEELSIRAMAIFDTPVANAQRTPIVDNLWMYRPLRLERLQYNFSPRFELLEAELKPDDEHELEQVVEQWRGAGQVELLAVGHTDATPVAARNRDRFADNYALSMARANAVAQYVAAALAVDAERTTVIGKGPDEPVADNQSAAGRASNRRVELTLQGQRMADLAALQFVKNDSGSEVFETTGRHEAPAPARRLVEQASAAEPAFAETGVIETLLPGFELLAPSEGFSPRIPSLKVAIKHAPNQVIELRLNDIPMSPLNFDSTQLNQAETVALSRWRGIDLEEGSNTLLAVVRDGESNEIARRERIVHYSGGPVRVQLDRAASTLVADGKTRPVIALKTYDRWGERAREGTIRAFRVDPPYRSWWEVRSLQENHLVAVGEREPIYKVAEDGLAYIELEPTTRTGEVVLKLLFPDEREQEIRAWLEPAPRDWILVGFAEGTVGYQTLEEGMVDADAAGLEEDLYRDGRVALFAKGQVKGEYLLTFAYDNDRKVSDAERRLHGTIDPDQYYTLYGDSSEQRYEAPSERALYVKLERRAFYALFGDFDTRLTITELSGYSRSLNGLQSEYHGDRYSYSAFAANTDTSFIKDEIAGDGTSGPYRLTRLPVVINSDKLRIEVRDRFRSEVILESRNLARHLDYSIDYLAGTLFIKQPVASRDQGFNPVRIVVEYESYDNAEEAITAGLRAAFTTPDRDFEVGASVIREGTVGDEGALYGADLRYQLSDVTEFKAELALSDTEIGGRSTAHLAELNHHGTRIDTVLYLREQEADFGFGQQSGTEAAMRKLGMNGRVRLSESLEIDAAAFRQVNLQTDGQRDVVETELRHQRPGRNAAVALMSARDDLVNGESTISNQALVSGSIDVLDTAISLRAAASASLGGDSANANYPERTLLGLDYKLTDSSTMFAEVEDAHGAAYDSVMTRIGVRSTPWNNAQINTAVNREAGEYGPRTFATLGLTQAWQMNERWLFDLGLDQAHTVGDNPQRLNDVVPPASGSVAGDFLASFVGASYRAEDWTITSRLEYRQSEEEDRLGLFGGFYREQSDGIGFSASLHSTTSRFSRALEATEADLRLGWAFRPADSAWIIFDRLDLVHSSRDDGASRLEGRRIVNNINANWRVDRHTELSLQYGAKYVRSHIDSNAYTGYTDLTGVGFRRDLNSRWDVGAHGDKLHSHRSNVRKFSGGIDAGHTFAKNVWVSVGYNFIGFRDDDFSAGNYTARGPFITLRMKADQETLQGLMRRRDHPRIDPSGIGPTP